MLFRYPGSKSKISDKIVKRILQIHDSHPFTEYCEPFFGGGSVCFCLLETAGPAIKRVWVNDLDPGIFAVWWSVVNQPKEFKMLIHNFKPTREAFKKFRQELAQGVECPVPELALKKIAVHQMSFSGLGVMAGGPMSEITSRWSPKWIDKNIDNVRRLLSGKNVTITNLDYRSLLSRMDRQTFVYLDPPFFEQGSALYQYSFSNHDHKDLRELLESAKFPWMLSYDNHPVIRRMYRRDLIHEVPVSYTINGVARKNELLITSKRYSATLHDLGGLNGRTIPASLPLSPFAGKFVDFDVLSHLGLYDFFTRKQQESSNIESCVLGVE
jgi:DNA adenine methylase